MMSDSIPSIASPPVLSEAMVIAQNPALLSCELDDDLVLMSIEGGAYYSLNVMGRCIWQALETPQSVAELCQQLQQQFEVAPGVCEQEVTTYLQELLTENLIRVR